MKRGLMAGVVGQLCYAALTLLFLVALAGCAGGDSQDQATQYGASAPLEEDQYVMPAMPQDLRENADLLQYPDAGVENATDVLYPTDENMPSAVLSDENRTKQPQDRVPDDADPDAGLPFTVMESDNVVDPDDDDQLAGYSSNIFLAKVDSQEGEEGKAGIDNGDGAPPPVPQRQYRVEVSDQLKGTLPEDSVEEVGSKKYVTVNQEGGINEDGVLELMNGDRMMVPGYEYVVLTTYDATNNWFKLSAQPQGDVQVESPEHRANLIERFSVATEFSIPYEPERGQNLNVAEPTPDNDIKDEDPDTAPTGSAPKDEEQPPMAESTEGDEVVAGNFIVTYDETVDPQEIRDDTLETKDAVGGTQSDPLPDGNSEVIAVPPTSADTSSELEDLKTTLEAEPSVESVDYDLVAPIQEAWLPNDPLMNWVVGSHYEIRGSGQNRRRVLIYDYYPPPQDEMWGMDVPKGWDSNNWGQNVTVSIMDSGCHASHYELSQAGGINKITAQKDFARGDNIADDETGHGTAMAGPIVANTNNGWGMASISHSARAICAKMTWKNPDGATVSSQSVINSALQWSIDQGARVYNMSFTWNPYNQAMQNLINTAHVNGVLVAATNNQGTRYEANQWFPTGYTWVLGVGASNGSNADWVSWSNYGPITDVIAPGENVVTTQFQGNGTNAMSATVGGTSMSTPLTAAVAADLISKKPSATGEQIKVAIQNGAMDCQAAGWDEKCGYGRVNLANALAKLT